MADTLQTASESLFTSTNIIAALIGIVGTVFVTVLASWLTYRYTRKTRLEAEWRIDKLKHYQELMSGLTDTINNLNFDVGLSSGITKYMHAANLVALVAPQQIVTLLNEVNEAVGYVIEEDSEETRAKVVNLIRKLILELRCDLNIVPKDNPGTFQFFLWIGSDKSNLDNSDSSKGQNSV